MKKYLIIVMVLLCVGGSMIVLAPPPSSVEVHLTWLTPLEVVELKTREFQAVTATVNMWLDNITNIRNIGNIGGELVIGAQIDPTTHTIFSIDDIYDTGANTLYTTNTNTLFHNLLKTKGSYVLSGRLESYSTYVRLEMIRTPTLTFKYQSFTGATDGRMIDIIYTTETFFLVVMDDGKITLVEADFGGAQNSTDLFSDSNDIDQVYSGCMTSTTNYRFYYINTSSQLIQVDLNVAAHTTSTSVVTTFTAPANYDIDKQIYWYQNGSEFLLNEDRFYYKNKNADSWVSITSSGETNIGIIWDFNDDGDYQINYISFKDTMYKVFKGGGIAKFQEFTPDSRVGWEDWINDPSGDVYVLATSSTKESIPLAFLSLSYNAETQEITAKDSVDNASLYETNQYWDFYDDDDNYLFDGFLTSSKRDEQRQLSLVFTTPWGLDRKRKVTYSDSGQTEATAVAGIEAFCDYCALTIEDATGTRNHSYDDQTVEACIDEIKKYQKLIEAYRPPLAVMINDGADASGTTLTEADPIGNFEYTKSPFQIKTVKLYGGIGSAGARITATAVNSAVVDGLFYQDYYPSITDQTTLNTLAASIIAQEGVEVTQFAFTIQGKGLLQYGKTINFKDTRRGDIDAIFNSADDYFMTSVLYNALSQECKVYCSNVLIFKLDKRKNDPTPAQNETLILQTAGNVSTNASGISDNASDISALENGLESSGNISLVKSNHWILKDGADEDDLDDVLSACSTAGGGIIEVHGTIAITSGKTLTGHTILDGKGIGMITATGYHNFFNLTGNYNRVRDIELSSSYTSNNIVFIRVQSTMNWIERCRIETDNGSTQKGYGIYLDYGANYCWITHNTFYNNYMSIRGNGNTNVIVDGNSIYNPDYGIGLYTSTINCSDWKIVHNMMSSVDVNSIYISGGDFIVLMGNDCNTNLYLTTSYSYIVAALNFFGSGITGSLASNYGNWTA